MNFFKPLATLAVLGAMGVILYLYTHKSPTSEPPPDAAGTWDSPPVIDVPPVGAELPVGLTEYDPTAPWEASPPTDAHAAAPTSDLNAPPYDAAPPLGETPPSASAAPVGSSLSNPSGVPDAGAAYGDLSPDASLAGASYDTSASAWPPDVSSSTVASSATLSPDIASAGPPATSDEAYLAARRQVGDLVARGDFGEALLSLTPWYKSPNLSASDSRELESLLSELAGTVIYSRDYHLEPPHAVAPGETLQSIADAYRVSPQLLANINLVPAGSDVQPGQQLKVLRGPFTAVVYLEAKELVLVVADRYAGRFAIGVGRDLPSMAGDWVVQDKHENPVYYGLDRTVAAGDPDNPLGKYWIGLQHENAVSAVAPMGIHGTNRPDRLQDDDPRGYIRLMPSDAKDAYEILSAGAPVVIRR